MTHAGVAGKIRSDSLLALREMVHVSKYSNMLSGWIWPRGRVLARRTDGIIIGYITYVRLRGKRGRGRIMIYVSTRPTTLDGHGRLAEGRPELFKRSCTNADSCKLQHVLS